MTRRALAPILLAPLAAAQPAPKLNHFYATVDAETYAAIEASAFLRERFAPFEKRTTVRNDATYSGLYFYGTETYFEFFEEGKGDREPQDTGLALGIETSAGSQSLLAQWQTLQPTVVANVTRQLDAVPIDWFDMTSFTTDTREHSAVPHFRLFAMEYKSKFLKSWHAGAPDSILQADVLAAYCAKLGLAALRKSTMLGDVDMLRIEGPGTAMRQRQLEAAGWSESNGQLRGPNAVVDLVAGAAWRGLTQIEFSLKRVQNTATIALGKSSLRLEGRRAVWTLVA